MSDFLLGPWNELIHQLSHYNLHIHTFIRDTPLNQSSPPPSSTINKDTLIGLMHQLSQSLREGSGVPNDIESQSSQSHQKTTEPLVMMKAMCDSINSQLNNTMTVKDVNVQSDVESFRCETSRMD